jgi:hypothetical protein
MFISLLLAASLCYSIPVYKSPDSLFESGDLSLKELEEKVLRETTRVWFELENKKGNKGWARKSDLFTFWDFASIAVTSDSTPLRSNPSYESKVTKKLKKGLKVQVLAVEENWLLIQQAGKPYWAPLQYLHPAPYDLGHIYITDGTKPRKKERIQKVDNLGIHALSLEKPTPIRNTLSLFHFIDGLVLEKGGPVFPVYKMLQRGYFVQKHGLIRFEDVSARIFDLSKAYAKDDGLMLRIHPNAHSTKKLLAPRGEGFKISNIHYEQWKLSKTRYDGDLWWNNGLPKELQKEKLRLSTTQLFNRRIFSMQKMKNGDPTMFASAKGLFKSLDGELWEPVSGFDEKDYPIAVSESGHIFVGDKRSIDGGKSFSNYIPWHEITQTLNKRLTYQADILELRKVKVLDKIGQHLEIKVHTGTELRTLLSANGGKSWTLQ